MIAAAVRHPSLFGEAVACALLAGGLIAAMLLANRTRSHR